MNPAALPADLERPVAPREHRKGPRPEYRPCEVCHDARLYLVRLTAGPLRNYALCVACLAQHDVDRAAGRVA